VSNTYTNKAKQIANPAKLIWLHLRNTSRKNWFTMVGEMQINYISGQKISANLGAALSMPMCLYDGVFGLNLAAVW